MHETFKTGDYGIVVALQMNQHFPIDRIATDRQKHVFVFHDSADVRRIANEFQSGQLQGSLFLFRSYFSALMKTLKQVPLEPRP